MKGASMLAMLESLVLFHPSVVRPLATTTRFLKRYLKHLSIVRTSR
jgi:hypothetical protein